MTKNSLVFCCLRCPRYYQHPRGLVEHVCREHGVNPIYLGTRP